MQREQPEITTPFGSRVEILSVVFDPDGYGLATVRWEDGIESKMPLHALRAPGGRAEIMNWLKSVGIIGDATED